MPGGVPELDLGNHLVVWQKKKVKEFIRVRGLESSIFFENTVGFDVNAFLRCSQ